MQAQGGKDPEWTVKGLDARVETGMQRGGRKRRTIRSGAETAPRNRRTKAKNKMSTDNMKDSNLRSQETCKARSPLPVSHGSETEMCNLCGRSLIGEGGWFDDEEYGDCHTRCLTNIGRW